MHFQFRSVCQARLRYELTTNIKEQMFVVTAKTSASNGACAHAWQTAAEYSKPEKLSGCFVPGPACLRVPVLAEV